MIWRVTPAEKKRILLDIAQRAAKREDKRRELGFVPVEKIRTRKKRTARQKLIDDNDALWSEVIRARDLHLYGPLCRVCHKNDVEVGYHKVPKKRGMSIRWLLENGCGGCSPCNYGERQNSALYREKHVSIFGRVEIEAIEQMARMVKVHFDLNDLLAINGWLRAIKKAGPGAPIPAPPSCMPTLASRL